MKHFAIGAAALLLSTPLAAEESAPANTGAWRFESGGGISDVVDCFEAAERTLISAHRGGPSPGLPENAVETMDAVLAAIPAVMEIDVAQSPDGVLYLMHDRTLDRTTTGSGSVRDVPWSEVEKLHLVDEAGWVTPYRVPTFRQALRWARGKTMLQIDFKRTADYGQVIDMIREEGMADSVILIAYNIGSASLLNELAPEMMLSASIESPGDLVALTTADVPQDRIFAFTGIQQPRPFLYEELNGEDVEVIFGTLGRPGESIDSVIAEYGMEQLYARLGEDGVDIIATDAPREAARALAAAGRLPEAGLCGVNREP